MEDDDYLNELNNVLFEENEEVDDTELLSPSGQLQDNSTSSKTPSGSQGSSSLGSKMENFMSNVRQLPKIQSSEEAKRADRDFSDSYIIDKSNKIFLDEVVVEESDDEENGYSDDDDSDSDSDSFESKRNSDDDD